MPAATITLHLGAGFAVAYFISTVEGARRRGIGAPIALAALCEARGIVRGVGVLGSSPMGYSVYRGLGSEELCRIEIYEWRPSA